MDDTWGNYESCFEEYTKKQMENVKGNIAFCYLNIENNFRKLL